MKTACRIVVGCLSLVILCISQAAAESPRPAFQNLRFDEDSAAYKDVAPVGLLDSLKFVSLNQSGSAFVSIGGQARIRGESWENFGFGSGNDDEFGLLRLRLHGDIKVNENIRAFVELKSSHTTGRDLPGGNRTLDVDDFAVQNAFIDLKSPIAGADSVLRVGRQELSYGKQRLISPLDWSNTRRTWEGAKLIVSDHAWRIDLFATEFVPVDKHSSNQPDDNSAFFGAYLNVAPDAWNSAYDVYVLRLDTDMIPSGDAFLNEERYTGGARMYGACLLTGIKYDLEGGYQFGDRGAYDVDAWFAAAELAYDMEGLPAAPKVHVGYDYASGDSDPMDDRLETFNQLFPLGHAYLGSIDVIGRQNIEAYNAGVTFVLVPKKVTMKFAYHVFRRAEREDALYNAGGGVVRAGDAGDSRDVGDEYDLTVTYQLNRNLVIAGGYSHFNAGTFIKDSGPSSDIDFGFLSLQSTF